MKTSNRSQWEEIKNLRRLWPFLKEQPLAFTLTVSLIPLISLLQLAQPILLKHAIDQGIMGQDPQSLALYAGIFLFLVVCEYLSRSGQSIASAITVERMIRTMRVKLAAHLLSMPLSFHHKHLSGVLVTRSTSEFDNLSESLNEGMLQSVIGIVSILGCVVGMISLHPVLGILSTLILPLVIYAVGWFSQKIKNSLLQARRYLAQLNGFTQECLQGMPTIKVLVAEKEVSQKFRILNENFRKSQMDSVTFDSILFSFLDGVSSVTIGIMLWVILVRLGYDQRLSAGTIVAFVRYLQQIFDPLKQLGQTVAFLQGVFTSTERIFGLFDHKERIAGTQVLPKIEGRVHFQNLSFSYHNGEGTALALKNINLNVIPGQSVALVGPTGGGKSTMIKLLTKQYEGFSGTLTIDGHDIRNLEPFSLRHRIAVVPQDLVLFSGSLAFNIGLGNRDISQASIEHAAKLVGLDRIVKTLPGQYEFKIDEEGSNLSLGQRQLIVFARALARDPHLVILDEASSSLDPVSESMVQGAVSNIFKKKTVIVIAHRLSTIRNCDKIVVVQNGSIVEEGRHEDLLAKQGLYHKLSLSLV